MSTTANPPVPGPNQLERESKYVTGIPVPTSDSSLAFSPAFIARFGEPCAWWSNWARLINTDVARELIPTYHMDYIEFVYTVDTVAFFGNVDRKCLALGREVLGRRTMEASFIQTLLKKFEAMDQDQAKLLSYVGPNRSHNRARVWDDVDAVLGFMKYQLKVAVTSLVKEDARKYWAAKPGKYQLPNLDITEIEKEETPENSKSMYDDDFDWDASEAYETELEMKKMSIKKDEEGDIDEEGDAIMADV